MLNKEELIKIHSFLVKRLTKEDLIKINNKNPTLVRKPYLAIDAASKLGVIIKIMEQPIGV